LKASFFPPAISDPVSASIV